MRGGVAAGDFRPAEGGHPMFCPATELRVSAVAFVQKNSHFLYLRHDGNGVSYTNILQYLMLILQHTKGALWEQSPRALVFHLCRIQCFTGRTTGQYPDGLLTPGRFQHRSRWDDRKSRSRPKGRTGDLGQVPHGHDRSAAVMNWSAALRLSVAIWSQISNKSSSAREALMMWGTVLPYFVFRRARAFFLNSSASHGVPSPRSS